MLGSESSSGAGGSGSGGSSGVLESGKSRNLQIWTYENLGIKKSGNLDI